MLEATPSNKIAGEMRRDEPIIDIESKDILVILAALIRADLVGSILSPGPLFIVSNLSI